MGDPSEGDRGWVGWRHARRVDGGLEGSELGVAVEGGDGSENGVRGDANGVGRVSSAESGDLNLERVGNGGRCGARGEGNLGGLGVDWELSGKDGVGGHDVN